MVSSALGLAASQAPEEQEVMHKEDMIKILERAASDSKFIYDMLYYGADALDEYDLTGPEKLATWTGDIEWIEKHIGQLTPLQRRWLELRKKSEIW